MPQRLTRLRVKTAVYLSAAGRNLGKANSLGEIARIGVHAYFRIDRPEGHAKVCRDERAGRYRPITKTGVVGTQPSYDSHLPPLFNALVKASFRVHVGLDEATFRHCSTRSGTTRVFERSPSRETTVHRSAWRMLVSRLPQGAARFADSTRGQAHARMARVTSCCRRCPGCDRGRTPASRCSRVRQR